MLDCAKDHTFSMCVFVCLDFVVRNDPKQKKFKFLSGVNCFVTCDFHTENISKKLQCSGVCLLRGKSKGSCREHSAA